MTGPMPLFAGNRAGSTQIHAMALSFAFTIRNPFPAMNDHSGKPFEFR